MGQGRKMRLLILPKELFENMCRHNSSFIIANTKETKISLIGQFFRILGKLLRPFKGIFIIEVIPPPVISLLPRY